MGCPWKRCCAMHLSKPTFPYLTRCHLSDPIGLFTCRQLCAAERCTGGVALQWRCGTGRPPGTRVEPDGAAAGGCATAHVCCHSRDGVRTDIRKAHPSGLDSEGILERGSGGNISGEVFSIRPAAAFREVLPVQPNRAAAGGCAAAHICCHSRDSVRVHIRKAQLSGLDVEGVLEHRCGGYLRGAVFSVRPACREVLPVEPDRLPADGHGCCAQAFTLALNYELFRVCPTSWPLCELYSRLGRAHASTQQC